MPSDDRGKDATAAGKQKRKLYFSSSIAAAFVAAKAVSRSTNSWSARKCNYPRIRRRCNQLRSRSIFAGYLLDALISLDHETIEGMTDIDEGRIDQWAPVFMDLCLSQTSN